MGSVVLAHKLSSSSACGIFPDQGSKIMAFSPITLWQIDGETVETVSDFIFLQAGEPGSIPGSGRSPGQENGNPLQHSCLENSMDTRQDAHLPERLPGDPRRGPRGLGPLHLHRGQQLQHQAHRGPPLRRGYGAREAVHTGSGRPTSFSSLFSSALYTKGTKAVFCDGGGESGSPPRGHHKAVSGSLP